MPIDREALVRRHNPALSALDIRSPLSVGNGRFCFTADITGLQTLDAAYADTFPLCTMAEWGWHSYPQDGSRADARERSDYEWVEFDAQGRKVPYLLDNGKQSELYNALRVNPHRFHLGRLRLTRAGAPIAPERVTEPRQTLDMWTGTLESRFLLDGAQVSVTTVCDPYSDTIGVRILTELPDVRAAIDFPYPSENVCAADWSRPDAHTTKLSGGGIEHVCDSTRYWTVISPLAVDGNACAAPHTWLITESEFTCRFAQHAAVHAPDFEDVLDASRAYWPRYWRAGAALELAHNPDPRAFELERRVILSQYLTAIQSRGIYPPAETGLTMNSWYGKFHLEMHFWHSAHFACWGRTDELERSLQYYFDIMPEARAIAVKQGYPGVRWPKMTEPSGLDSPSPIGPMLIWQQMHPVYYAELCYRAHPDTATLARYAPIVEETTAFLLAYLAADERGALHIGPPVIPAQENWKPASTRDPAFELEYVHFAFEIARKWRQRMDMPASAELDDALSRLAKPHIENGVYPAVENGERVFEEMAHDHPSMLCACGVLPGDTVDSAAMLATLTRVLDCWDWDSAWGWDFPVLAMCAARLGLREEAVDLLLMDALKNTYAVSGHNYQRPNLPLYLPGNGGLLLAVAFMSAGCEGFPAAWDVRCEGMTSLL